MAVVINGSGTVTGLAVGGLPDGTVDAGTLATDSVTAAKIPDTVEADLKSGRKNLIINGAMQVSQRGDYTTATANVGSGNYYLDRFNVTPTLGMTVQQSTGYPKSQSKTYKLNVTATDGTGNIQTVQPIEDDYTGYELTLSAWVKSNNVNARLNVLNGTWGHSVTHSGNGEWEKLTTTFTCTTSNLQIAAAISTEGMANVSLPQNDYIEISQMQLEVGSQATEFEHRSYGEELALCQRYYQIIKNSIFMPTNPSTGQRIDLIYPLLAPLRDGSIASATRESTYPDGTIYANNALSGASGSDNGIVYEYDDAYNQNGWRVRYSMSTGLNIRMFNGAMLYIDNEL